MGSYVILICGKRVIIVTQRRMFGVRLADTVTFEMVKSKFMPFEVMVTRSAQHSLSLEEICNQGECDGDSYGLWWPVLRQKR
jgi:hypothetical protein